MENINPTTQEKILEAAEKEFLEKGFEKAKIYTIAKEAGINHAMVHYYFGTKENIFDIIFRNKIELLAKQLGKSFDEGDNFFFQLEKAIDSHFDFIDSNPNILLFLLREVSGDSKQLKVLKSIVRPKVEGILQKLDTAIERETKKGTIRPVNAIDLLLNVVAMNASSFLIMSVIEKVEENDILSAKSAFLKHRREHIKSFIVNSIKV